MCCMQGPHSRPVPISALRSSQAWTGFWTLQERPSARQQKVSLVFAQVLLPSVRPGNAPALAMGGIVPLYLWANDSPSPSFPVLLQLCTLLASGTGSSTPCRVSSFLSMPAEGSTSAFWPRRPTRLCQGNSLRCLLAVQATVCMALYHPAACSLSRMSRLQQSHYPTFGVDLALQVSKAGKNIHCTTQELTSVSEKPVLH